MDRTPRRRATGVGIMVAALVATGAMTDVAAAAGPSDETRGLRKAVTLAGVREHQQAFQDISDANGGNRVGRLRRAAAGGGRLHGHP